MGVRWRGWVTQLVQTVVVVAVVAVAIDWWRKPVQPVAFATTTLQTLDGKSVTLTELSRNRPVIVYFWGSWCGICRYTSPVAERLHQNGIPVLGVALQSGSAAEVGAYMQAHGLHFDNVNDADGRISRQWQVAVTPTIAVVKDGKMIHHTTGLSSYWGLRSRIWLADWWY
ncbi:MAG: protein disulfide oxidoreductase [Neisseria sp.]|nr:protein disulfide oxidoreductase [Neisseria sp.]